MAANFRMSSATTSLLVVDIQEKLLPLIKDTPRLLLNAEFLLDVARLVDVPVFVTEQYPQGLGPTAPNLIAKLPANRPAKRTFSCCGTPGLVESLNRPVRPWVLVTGIETHVCISQTVFELLEQGFKVAVPADAVASRFEIDHDIALERMRSAGAVITTVEAATFEWLTTSAHPAFKEFSRLVQERSRDIGQID